MTAASLGLLGLIFVAIFTLAGSLLASRSPSKLAEMQGMKLMVDELRTDRNDLRVQVTELKTEIIRLRVVIAQLHDELARKDTPLCAIHR
jgi:hypothetical protein